jgi:hypothetical protein
MAAAWECPFENSRFTFQEINQPASSLVLGRKVFISEISKGRGHYRSAKGIGLFLVEKEIYGDTWGRRNPYETYCLNRLEGQQCASPATMA